MNVAEVKYVFIKNPLKFTIYVDNSINQEFSSDDAAIIFTHKTKFRNKIRRVVFSTKGTDPIMNGQPGAITRTSGDNYETFECTIPMSIQDVTWLGDWNVEFAYGPLDDFKFCVKAQDYLTFVDPLLEIESYSTALGCSITKVGSKIILGSLFRTNESELNGIDVLAQDLLV